VLTSELKSKIDAIWSSFWTNGIANPLETIEQFTYLLFLRRLSDEQNRRERIALQEETFVENPIFRDDEKRLQWKNWPADDRALYELVDREVFPWLRNIGGGTTSFTKNLKDARLSIPTSALLKEIVGKIDDLEDHAKRLAAEGESYLDTMGDLYEYLLSKLSTAGRNGQFRTPRHIIEMMVELAAPTPKSIICDPACGTAGFLANAVRYLQKNHKDAYFEGDNLYHFNNEAFIGTDVDATMVRIAAMNLLLHGVENPNVKRANALATEFAFESEICDVILANPPFAGSINETELSPNLKSATGGSKKSELLFIALFLRLLKAGGRAVVIVPDGVLFGAQKAHQTVRTELVEKHKLEAVISMPSGVFRPYAGVSTAILIFTKTGAGGTDNVWFYDMTADGFSLDDKRNPVKENDIPDLLEKWKSRADQGRTGKSFLVSKSEIAGEGYDLSLNRYKTVVYEAQTHRAPLELIAEIRTLESQLNEGLEQLESKLK
jgi:type I restriction enzyme M protein